MATFESQSVSGPNQTTFLDLAGIKLDDGVSYTSSIILADRSSYFKFGSTAGLAAAHGYAFDNELTEITFSGDGKDVQNALNQIIYTTGATVENTIEVAIFQDLPDSSYLMPGGNVYQHVEATIGWDNARNNALSSEFYGAKGYLPNITTEKENNFISSKVDAANIWIGGSDEGHEGIWKWMDGPEDEAGKTFWKFNEKALNENQKIKYPYLNQKPGDLKPNEFGDVQDGFFANWSYINTNDYGVEPNNAGLAGGEWNLGDSDNVGKTTGGGQSVPNDNQNYIVTNFNGESGAWNDSHMDNPKSIKGYLIEYETDDMGDSVNSITHRVVDQVDSGEDLVNECFLQVGGSGAIELGPGDDRLVTNQNIFAERLDGQSGFDRLILTNALTCDNANNFEFSEPKSMLIENFERIKIESGRWDLAGDFYGSDVIISGGVLRLELSNMREFPLRTMRNKIKVEQVASDAFALEVDFENIEPRSLAEGGKWRIARGINRKNFERIESSIEAIGLPEDVDDSIVFIHKKNSIFAVFEDQLTS